MKKKLRGFTLVELIVVIAIIGVLAAILVPSMMGYVKNSRLKTANSNAKLVFTTVSTICADAETQGVSVTSPSAAFSCIDGASADETNNKFDITSAVQSALSDNGSAAGVAYVDVTSNSVTLAQWHKTDDDTIIGQYPDPIEDVDALPGTSTLGTALTPKE